MIQNTPILTNTVSMKNQITEKEKKRLYQVLQYNQAITKYFPEDTKISRPRGGLFLWVELNKNVDTVNLYKKALRKNIAILPGKIFSLQNQFNNCMRLSYGLRWSERMEDHLNLLGKRI